MYDWVIVTPTEYLYRSDANFQYAPLIFRSTVTWYTGTLLYNPNEKHQEDIHTNNVGILPTVKLSVDDKNRRYKLSAHVQQPFALGRNLIHYYDMGENFPKFDTFNEPIILTRNTFDDT